MDTSMDRGAGAEGYEASGARLCAGCGGRGTTGLGLPCPVCGGRSRKGGGKGGGGRPRGNGNGAAMVLELSREEAAAVRGAAVQAGMRPEAWARKALSRVAEGGGHGEEEDEGTHGGRNGSAPAQSMAPGTQAAPAPEAGPAGGDGSSTDGVKEAAKEESTAPGTGNGTVMSRTARRRKLRKHAAEKRWKAAGEAGTKEAGREQPPGQAPAGRRGRRRRGRR